MLDIHYGTFCTNSWICKLWKLRMEKKLNKIIYDISIVRLKNKEP